VGVRPLCSQPRRASCALVLFHRRSDGHRRHDSQLEQVLAALVLAILVADVAAELLDRPAARGTPDRLASRHSRPMMEDGCLARPRITGAAA
jgi:hypothetical protein